MSPRSSISLMLLNLETPGPTEACILVKLSRQLWELKSVYDEGRVGLGYAETQTRHINSW